MSQSPMTPAAARDASGERTITDEATVQDVLEALDDDDCRAILRAASDDSLSASEVSEACDLPLSTAYRKLDLLTDVDLLEERTRISHEGKHASEYVRVVDDIDVSLAATGIELQVSRREEVTRTWSMHFVAGD